MTAVKLMGLANVKALSGKGEGLTLVTLSIGVATAEPTVKVFLTAVPPVAM